MKTLKYLVAWLPARAAFFVGDLFCRLTDTLVLVHEAMDAIDENQDADWIDDLYTVYNGFMGLSVQLDDWGSTKLWSEPGLP